MGALAPAFLAGLAAIAIPVLVHLIHRERKEYEDARARELEAASEV